VITQDRATRPRPPHRRPRRQARTWLRRLVVVVAAVVLVALAGVIFGGLWVLTPSVSDAEARASAFVQSHQSNDLNSRSPRSMRPL